AIEQFADASGVVGGVAALYLGQRRARQARILGGDFEARQIAALDGGDEGRAGGRKLIEPAVAVDDPGGGGAVGEEGGSDRLDPLLVEDAEHVAADAGRVRLRAQQVEHRTGAEFLPRRADVLHRWVVRRREHEAD